MRVRLWNLHVSQVVKRLKKTVIKKIVIKKIAIKKTVIIEKDCDD